MKKFEFNMKGSFVFGGGERINLNATYNNDIYLLQVTNYRIFKRFVEKNYIEERDVELPLNINYFNGTDNEDNRFIGMIKFRVSSHNKDNQSILLNYTDVAIHVVDLKTKQTYATGGLVKTYDVWYDIEADIMHSLDVESNSSTFSQITASTELINDMLKINHMNMKYVDMKKDIKPETENQKPMLISQAIWEQFKFISLGYLEPFFWYVYIA